MISTFIVYCLTAILGYLIDLEKTAKIATNATPINSVFAFLFFLGQVGVYIKLTVSVPINMNPLVKGFYDVIYSEKQKFSQIG